MKKILVIEDEAQSREMFLECLNAEGFFAIGAQNGRVGVQRAQEQLPDLVICDIVMPELDGYGVLNALCQNPATAIIPCIFLTTKACKVELRRCMELGADGYLIKPCTAEELLRAIAARLQRQDALRQYYAVQSQQVPETPSTGTASSVAPQSIFPSVPLLSEVFQFIEANYRQPITLGDVAQSVGYSRTYLTNLVGTQTGHTIYRWIVERRMAEARSLLRDTDKSVEQIAAAVGYQNAGHFCRQFRQHHGATPCTWRRENCNRIVAVDSEKGLAEK